MSVGVIAKDDFERQVSGSALSITLSPFWASVSTAHTIQSADVASIREGTRYLNVKRTVAGTGFCDRTLPGTTALRRMRYYLTLIAALSENSAVQYWTNNATNRAQILMTTTRTCQLRNITTVVGSASTALVLGKRYRFEYMFNPAASQQELNIYDPDETTVFYASGLLAAPATTANMFKIGNAVSATLEYNIDSVVDSDQVTEIGPVNPWAAGAQMMAA